MEKQIYTYLERPRVAGLLAEAVKSPLVTVCGGTGYGKTRAVSDFLQNGDADTAWIQLSGRDNLPSRFWESYRQAFSPFDKSVTQQLAKIGFPKTEDDFETYFIALDEWFSSGKKSVVVFDDLHLIRSGEILRFIEKRATTLVYPNSTVILISRTEPDINIVGMLSGGLAVNISEDELRFTEGECAEYLRLLGLTLSTEALADIYRDTEGWAFALNLVGHALEKMPNQVSAARAAMRLNICKLIENGAFMVISEKLRRLLVRISLLDHLSVDLVQIIAADEALAAELESVSAYIRRDVYSNTYRIHHLTLDYLREKRDILTEEEKRGAYSAAARWCEENGCLADAVSYYEKAGEYERLVRAVYDRAQQLPAKTARFLLEVFENAPPAEVSHIVHFTEMHLKLKMSAGLFSEADESAGRYLEYCTALPQTAFTDRVLSGIYSAMGGLRFLTAPDTDRYDFDTYIAKQGEYYSKSPYEAAGAAAIGYVGPWLSMVGTDRKGAMEEYLGALTRAAAHAGGVGGAGPMCGMSGLEELARGELLFYKDEVKEAERCVMRALSAARERNQYDIRNRALFYLIRIGFAQGNFAKIGQALKELEAQLGEKDYAIRYTSYDIVMGRYYLMMDLPENIAAWLKLDFEPGTLTGFMERFGNTVKARYYYAAKQYHLLLAFLESGHGREPILLGRIEAKALEAVCLYQIKNRDAALIALSEAYEMARSNDLTLPFIELGRDMRTLAASALRDKGRGIPRAWLEAIGKKSSTYAKRRAVIRSEYRKANNLGGDVRLSDRETEILIDLCHGLSRSEIAAGHDLSINTVKLIVNMVYTKLGADSLADVVRIAAERQLI
ncbi:MAG: LuxR C-terminal-related transcriptional regulator [Clostridiales Family XIII bacterium]|jgi:LuxR family maltose regulon positive regulatory protein|nr:LuxR C-terminal-related transcriptional regulator [Clostridiales Family XIII bacterium]